MEIDRKTLKALAADTRLDILKSLSRRRKMPSELSKELNLAASTVIEHLDRLEEADLVRREETGHKWIYYSLTEKGESLVKPRYPVNFVIILSVTILVIFVSGFLIYTDYTRFQAIVPALTNPSEEAAKTGVIGSITQNVTNFTFNSGTGSCNSGKQTEIIGEDNKIKFSGSIGTPNPCYELKGFYSKNGSNITIEITSKSVGEICIQCVGSVPFDGYLEISEGHYKTKIIYNERIVAEKDVDVI